MTAVNLGERPRATSRARRWRRRTARPKSIIATIMRGTKEEGRREEEEEWEDFMARYWHLKSRPPPVSPRDAVSIFDAEDTDLKPCAIGPELDEGVALLGRTPGDYE